MAFHVGQKVVCISDFPEIPQIIRPEKGRIYTVRALLDIGTEPSLRVFEIKNAPMNYSNINGSIEPAFVMHAFRPLVARKTDISIFTKMLTDKRETSNA